MWSYRFCSYQQGYKDWVNKNGPELRLPGLNMTNEQLLFVSFAQVKIWIEVFEVFKILWWDTLCGLGPSFFGEVRRTSQTKTSVNNKLMFAHFLTAFSISNLKECENYCKINCYRAAVSAATLPSPPPPPQIGKGPYSILFLLKNVTSSSFFNQ